MDFPKDFIWGAGSTAYQIEGAVDEDGKSRSIWDVFTKEEGKVWSGHTGNVALNHYHEYQKDVALMKEIGLRSYLFSVAWSRIIPEGTEKVNHKGLDFYDRLIDRLLENNIQPFITLYHWDMPFNLHCRGGWLNPDSPDWFAEYTRVVVQKFSDRVSNWITQCEPQCFIEEGYANGVAAPGYKMGWTELLKISHTVLLAHGKSVQTIRAHAKKTANVGITSIGVVHLPQTAQENDIAVAREAMFSIEEKTLWNNTWFLDPIFLGTYPEDGLEVFRSYLPQIKTGDMRIISEPVDFLGLTIYEGSFVKKDDNGKIQEVPFEQGFPLTTMKFPITPSSLYWGPKLYYERYNKPIFITENGVAYYDTVSLDGCIHDPQRIDYIQRHLLQLKDAVKDDVDVKGYFYWSLMDNFEWQDGYKERFGLIHVDYNTQKRTIKESAYWYKKIIETNGNSLST